MKRKKEPIWILESTILKIHDAQLAEHGGSSGIRDQGLLQSALHHPINLFSYSEPTLFELAATYAARIAKNHPFIDGNKRTAYVTMRLFLSINEYDLRASREDRVSKLVQIANGMISEKDLAFWLNKHSFKLK